MGNTFGATALSSYGGFWISFGIIFTPGGFNIEKQIVTAEDGTAFLNAIGFFLMVCTHLRVHPAQEPQLILSRAGSSSRSYSSFVP